MAVIGEMDVFGINKDKQYEVVDRKSRQSIEKINKDINNSDKDVTAGKVWKSTSEGAGWADSDSMSDNQSGGVDITINGVKRTLQKYDETPDSMADNENGGVDITIGGTKKTVAKQADLKEIEKSQNELKSDIDKLENAEEGTITSRLSESITEIEENKADKKIVYQHTTLVDGVDYVVNGTGKASFIVGEAPKWDSTDWYENYILNVTPNEEYVLSVRTYFNIPHIAAADSDLRVIKIFEGTNGTNSSAGLLDFSVIIPKNATKLIIQEHAFGGYPTIKRADYLDLEEISVDNNTKISELVDVSDKTIIKYNYFYEDRRTIQGIEATMSKGAFELDYGTETQGHASNLKFKSDVLDEGTYTMYFELDSTFSYMYNFGYCNPGLNVIENGSLVLSFSYTGNNRWEKIDNTLSYTFTVKENTVVEFGLYLPESITGKTDVRLILAKQSVFFKNLNCGYLFAGATLYSNVVRGGGKTYYLSSDGDDNNDGLSAQYPKANLSEFNGVNDITILMRSGDEFFTNGKFKTGNNVRMGCYGGLERPVINGLKKSVEGFEKSDTPNIYMLELPDENIGFIELPNKKRNWKMAETLENIEDDEWICSGKTLYYCTSNDVSGVKVSYAQSGSGIIVTGTNNVVIDGIEIKNFGEFGISIGSKTSNIDISNCEIHHIGGSKLGSSRYGNGIQIWIADVENVNITKNIIYDCFDAGFTPQVTSETDSTKDTKNIYFTHNYIRNCAYPIEVFCHLKAYRCKNVVIANNYVRNCKDITERHRVGANHYFYAQMVLWNLNNASGNNNRNEVIIENNVCIGSESFAIAFHESDSGEQYIIRDNVFVTEANNDNSYILHNNGEQIYLPQYYHGMNDKFVVLDDNNYMMNIGYYSTIGQELLLGDD